MQKVVVYFSFLIYEFSGRINNLSNARLEEAESSLHPSNCSFQCIHALIANKLFLSKFNQRVNSRLTSAQMNERLIKVWCAMNSVSESYKSLGLN